MGKCVRLAVLLALWGTKAIFAQSVSNPGFETGSIGPWAAYIPGTGSITVGTTSHSGSYGLIEGPNSAAEVAYQNIYGLTPGQSYVVSVWVEASASTGTVSLYLDDTQGNNYQGTAAIAPTTSWQQISCTYTATSSGAMAIHLVEQPGSEMTYWDDVVISGGSLSSNVWSNLSPDVMGLSDGINGLDLWENPGFYSAFPGELTKEYIYLNGQIVSIENVGRP